MTASESDPKPNALESEATQTLLNAAISGQSSALNALFERLSPALDSWARLRMSPSFQRRLDPQDIVQEVWLRVTKRILEVDVNTTNLRAWVFRMAQLVLIESSRELVRRNHQASTSSFLSQQSTDDTGVSTRIAGSDAVQSFLDRVRELSASDRELILLRGLEGRSFEEIAVDCGGSAAVWKKRWQRLRTRMAERGIPDYLL